MRLAAVFSILIFASACGSGERGRPNVTQPSTVPPPGPATPPPSPAAGVISIGEEVKDTLTYNGAEKIYVLTAPSDGVLVAQVRWDTKDGILELWLDGTRFGRHSSPTVGSLRVSAGRTYRVRVADGAPWDYGGLYLPFVLTTSVE